MFNLQLELTKGRVEVRSESRLAGLKSSVQMPGSMRDSPGPNVDYRDIDKALLKADGTPQGFVVAAVAVDLTIIDFDDQIPPLQAHACGRGSWIH